MKKTIACALLALTLLSVEIAKADVGSATLIITNATGNTTSSEIAVDRASFIRVQAYAATTSTCTVKVQTRSTSSAPWITVATMNNPDNTDNSDFYYIIPVAMKLRVDISAYAAGNVYVVLETHQISP